jgi:insecticidal toxin complex protein TccC
MGTFTMTHANTPAIQVFDPRGLSVRGVAYHRRESASVPEPCITQQEYDGAGRAVLGRDPRLFRLHQDGQTATNQQNVFSLSGAVVLSQNTDAGWRLGMLGAHGQRVEGWDQKLSQSHVDYDPQCRPVAAFERARQGPERCIARFTYAGTDADDDRNLRGQLIRHDDTAGTLRFTGFSLNATPLQHDRTFIDDPQWQVDWPESEPERDALLESERAITRLHCNAAGEPVSQTDALGNRQTFIHTCAGELREIRVKLAGPADETTLVRDIRYNAFAQIELQHAGNGVVSSATYRPDDGRLQHLKAYVTGQPALQDLTYEYDAVGNVTGIIDATEATHFHRNQRIEPVSRYRYDSLYRLIEASGRQSRNASGGPQLPEFQSAADPGQLENYTRLYTYDEAGNLAIMQHQADSASRTELTAVARFSNRSLPEKANGELPDEQEIALGHDLNGNRTRLQPGQTLQWDLRNQLRQVDQVVREDEPNDCEFYVYDGSGQRQRKIRRAYTGTLTRTHETRYLPGVQVRTCTDETLHVLTIKAGRSTVQILHWQTEPPAKIPQDQHRYGFTDHLGSSALELDETALLISRESHYPYGGTCWWAGRNKLEASYKTLRYSGQERDATGLYYYGFRYYVPWFQRWLSADPSGTLDGLNLYAMVHGNPVGHVDIAGLVDDHSSQATSQQLLDASTSAFARDFISRGIGGLVQMSTVAALGTLPPTRATNNALEITAGAIEGLAVALVGGGLAARIHPGAVGLGAALGLLVGIQPAVWSANDEVTETEESELNPIAINRIGVAAGSVAREISQQILRGHGANFPWGNVNVRQRLPTIGRTALAYSVLRGLSGAFSQFVPEAMRSWISPMVEGIDGFIGTWLRGLHPETRHSAGNFSLQTPPPLDTLFGAAGRVSGSVYTYGMASAVNAITQLATALPSSERGALISILSGGTNGLLSAATEYRGAIMQAAQDGYRRLFPQVANNMSADVQTTSARFPGRTIGRRHSFNGI